MSNSKLYQPPPPPPKMPAAPVDPLVALSKAPTMIAPVAAPVVAEELTDLTDDEALEQWAQSGTKVMPKLTKSTPPPPSQSPSQPQHVPTMVSAPLPSFYPVAYSTPPRIHEKKTSAAIWVVPLALFVFAGGVVAAAAGWYVYHTSDLATAATVDTSSNVTVTAAPTETAPPAVTLTATATTAPAVTTTTPPPPVTTATAAIALTTPSTRRGSTSTITATNTNTTSTGSIRTFAAGNGKPVYVDGKQVGYGGGRITTACGHHTVSVGTGHARSVEIPCTGTTLTVGTPDGT